MSYCFRCDVEISDLEAHENTDKQHREIGRLAATQVLWVLYDGICPWCEPDGGIRTWAECTDKEEHKETFTTAVEMIDEQFYRERLASLPIALRPTTH